MKTLALSAVLAFATAACAVDPSAPSDHMKIYETCLETQCDQMQQHDDAACSACESACFSASYDCDPSSACSDYDRSTCVDQGYKVVLANDPDPTIEDACNAALTHIASCGYSSSATPSDCTRYAANESSDAAIPAYQCVAQLDCSSLTDSNATQACDPAPSTFGDDFCAALASACPDQACSSNRQSQLDADAAWLRPDALDAARSCLSQPSCKETSDCISAWVSAVQ